MFAVACFIVLISIILTKWLISKEKPKGTSKGLLDIPRAGGLPIVGNISDFLCSEVEQWRRSRERARKYFPIYRIQVFGSNIVSLVDPDDIQIILGDSKQTSKGEIHEFMRQLIGYGLVGTDGEIWYKKRKWMTKSFHFSVLRNYVEIFNNGVKQSTERFRKEANVPADALLLSKHLMLRIVNECVLGEPTPMEDKDIVHYIEGVETILKILHYNFTRPYLTWLYRNVNMKIEVERGLKHIRNLVEKVLVGQDLSKKVENAEGTWKLLDLLLGGRHIFQKEEEIKDEVNFFLLGAHDGSSNAMCYAFMTLANYPTYQEEIYQEMKEIVADLENPTYTELNSLDLMDRFLKETMRLYPPAPYIVRQLNSEVVTKSGYTLPVGTQLLIRIFDVHRNPNVFHDPDTFNPDRFLPDNVRNRHPFSYIPFSAGPRNCLAQKFAVLKIKACICGILKNFKLEPITTVKDLVFVPNSIFVTKDPVMTKFVPRMS